MARENNEGLEFLADMHSILREDRSRRLSPIEMDKVLEVIADENLFLVPVIASPFKDGLRVLLNYFVTAESDLRAFLLSLRPENLPRNYDPGKLGAAVLSERNMAIARRNGIEIPDEPRLYKIQ